MKTKLMIILVCLLMLLPIAANWHIQNKKTEAGYQQLKQQVLDDLLILNRILIGFKLDTGRYPTDEEGVLVLIADNGYPKPAGVSANGYLKGIAKDPWGNPYHYTTTPRPHFFSYGADGKQGGTGPNSDIYPE
ncbi:type II secretion system protein GspG [Methylophaga sp. OBS4]|uniref:type II secretion system protein GspG n=1 Tax=Methylophaga sp. OBS4 TaxID=2991935 RepID=UPI002257ACF9|nr:type II secretion system protein GspG [Methylophaga sp. OBS4]MCX4188029.1 type II secretion system protein GspG [Methylophaga sp. OBS4]